ncbi:MAG: nitroreductase family protein [Desulfobacterales bacterium]|nr:nitroreductase family protein [Desulfobacterales bacterium]MDD3081481.1 nitroreductase family protein [Desulfobacterales bacterium]MDD3950444.1 nitroreductase family protein [Desulfobacterales bacterium]MDY0377759.1 nitroreductase family protein [Desulfobacterales bacterium]
MDAQELDRETAVMLEALIRKNRSCRRFYQNHRVDVETLRHLVDLARLSASAANRQPLKYVLSCDGDVNAEIFLCLQWAGYLKQWAGPEPGEQPSAYIILLGDRRISADFSCDPGIAAQSILLGATEKGLAGCIIAAVDRKRLSNRLEIPDCLEILLVLAIGKPGEQIVIEPVGPDGDIRYWRDDHGVHHVPKRDLDEVVFACYGPGD